MNKIIKKENYLINPLRDIPYLERLKIAKVIDLRDNYKIIQLKIEKFIIEPIDKNKFF